MDNTNEHRPMKKVVYTTYNPKHFRPKNKIYKLLHQLINFYHENEYDQNEKKIEAQDQETIKYLTKKYGALQTIKAIAIPALDEASQPNDDLQVRLNKISNDAKERRKIIKEAIKGSYSKKVTEYLLLKGECKKNNKPYTPTEVKQVFSGFRNNDTILNAILTVYKDEKQQAEALQAKFDTIAATANNKH